MKPITQFIAGAAIATGLIFGGLALSEAKAAEAKWKTTQYWNIVGDYSGYCRAEATFGDEMLLSMGLNKDGWKLMFANKNAIPMEVGKPYTLQVALTNGVHGTLTGTAFDAQGLAFSGLTPQFVEGLAYSDSIVIGNFGKFNLKGSLDAILETYACFKAITSAGAKATTSIQKDREA